MVSTVRKELILKVDGLMGYVSFFSFLIFVLPFFFSCSTKIKHLEVHCGAKSRKSIRYSLSTSESSEIAHCCVCVQKLWSVNSDRDTPPMSSTDAFHSLPCITVPCLIIEQPYSMQLHYICTQTLWGSNVETGRFRHLWLVKERRRTSEPYWLTNIFWKCNS